MIKRVTNISRSFYSGCCIGVLFILCLGYANNSSGQISYSYGWESGGLGGWTSTSPDADQFESTGSQFLQICSGNRSAVANVYEDYFSILTSDNLGTSNGDVVTLGYRYKVTEFPGTTTAAPADQVLIEVQYASSPSGLWTTVQTINSSNHMESINCAYMSVTFTTQQGNFYLRFKCTAVGSDADLFYFIDDVSLSQGGALSCPGPSNLFVSGLTTTTANIGFNAPSTMPANGYDYYVSTSNTAPANTATPTGNGPASPLLIASLAANTTYYIWARSNCSDTAKSTWGEPLSFTTQCEPVNVPYEQPFESATPPAIPGCTSIQNAGTGNNWKTVASPDAGGFTAAGGMVLQYTSSPDAANAWWYSQGINLTAGIYYAISYKYGRSNVFPTGATEKMKVACGTSADTAAMTNLLANHANIDHTAQVNTAYFSPAASGVYYFGFNVYSNAGQSYLNLDSIKVDVAPDCIPPTGLTASSITATSASIGFTVSPSNPANGYDYYISTSNAAPAGTTTPTGNSAAAPVALSGLAPNTTYYVWMRSSCSGTGQSIWNSLSFRTNIINDDAAGAMLLTVNGGCTGNPYTNVNATVAAGEPFPSCSGTAGVANVWYKFIAPASGAVKVSCDGTGTIGNTRMALFSSSDSSDYSTFNILACDDNNGVQTSNRSLFYNFGLTPGGTYYIALDIANSQPRGTFCLTVDAFSASMLSSAAGDCQISQSGSGSNVQSVYKGWTSLVDNAGNLIANVRGINNTATQNYASRLTVKTDPMLRTDTGGLAYMNRNFLITGTNTSSADVQLFFTDDELIAMGGNIATLNVTRVSGNTCAADFIDGSGATALLTQTANGAAGGINYIQFNTPGFSNFYIMNGTTPLPITFEYFRGRKMGNGNRLDWKLNNSEPGTTLMALERSEDGKNFTPIWEQKISGRDNNIFSYDDRSIKAVANHYRIHLTTESGKQSYSRIVTLINAVTGFELVNIVPNPVKNSAQLQMAAAQKGSVTVLVSDIAGRVLAKRTVLIEEGNNAIEMDFSYLNAGTYQLSVTNDAGASKVLRFVKY